MSTDGTQKMPFRWGAVAEWNLKQRRIPDGLAYGLAAWSEFVRRAVRDGLDLGDPAGAQPLTDVVHEQGVDNVAGIAIALLGLPGSAGTDQDLAAAVVRHAAALAAAGNSLV